jgi:hypothetical protein
MFFGKYVVTQEHQTLCGLTEGKFGPVTGAHVMSAYLPARWIHS